MEKIQPMGIHLCRSWIIFIGKILIYTKNGPAETFIFIWASLSSFTAIIRNSSWVCDLFAGKIYLMRLHLCQEWPILLSKILIYSRNEPNETFIFLWASLSSFTANMGDSSRVYGPFLGKIKPMRLHLCQAWAIFIRKILNYDQDEIYDPFLSSSWGIFISCVRIS